MNESLSCVSLSPSLSLSLSCSTPFPYCLFLTLASFFILVSFFCSLSSNGFLSQCLSSLSSYSISPCLFLSHHLSYPIFLLLSLTLYLCLHQHLAPHFSLSLSLPPVSSPCHGLAGWQTPGEQTQPSPALQNTNTTSRIHKVRQNTKWIWTECTNVTHCFVLAVHSWDSFVSWMHRQRRFRGWGGCYSGYGSPMKSK